MSNNFISESTYRGFYYSFNVILILFEFPFLIMLIIRLRNEFRCEYVDVFKVLQYLTFISVCIITFVLVGLLLALPQYTLFYLKLGQLVLVNILAFQLTNLLSWVVLLYHLRSYKKLWNDFEYEEVRTRIRRVEWAMLIILLTYYISAHVMWIFNAIVQLYMECIQKRLDLDPNKGPEHCLNKSANTEGLCGFNLFIGQYLAHYLDLAMQISLIVLLILSFAILLKMLKHNLNYYYHDRKVKLMILLALSLFFIIFNTTYFFVISKDYFHYDMRVALYCGVFNVSLEDMIVWMVYNTLSQIPLLLYAYFSMNNINFKQYIKDIISGYRMQPYYANCSIFIWHYPGNSQNESTSAGSEHDRGASLDTVNSISLSFIEDELGELSDDRNTNNKYKANFLFFQESKRTLRNTRIDSGDTHSCSESN